jgi:hypothetical protein
MSRLSRRYHLVEDATGDLSAQYERYKQEGRPVPGIIKTMSLRPDFLQAIDSASRLHFTDGTLTRAQHEMIASYVSAFNRCRY